jgi:hypothetical protein
MRDADSPGRQVALGLAITLRRADVQEVAVAQVGEERLASLQQEGDELVAEIEE